MKHIAIIKLLPIILLFTVSAAMAQTGSISGTIITSDGQPAVAVSVGLKNKGLGTLTDANGYYEIKKVKPGNYTLRISAIGLTVQEKVIKVLVNQKQTVNFTLSENAEQLKEVVVSASRNKYKIDKPSPSLRLNEPLLEVPQNVQVVTSSALADQQVISMSDGLIRNVSGVTRLEHWADLYTNISMRGSQIQAFRNGFNVVASYWGPLTEDMSFVDHIEFVKGPAGFMLANGDPSGLYNVVTKKPTGQNKGEASFTVGSYDLYRVTLDLDGKLSKDGRLLYRFNVAGQNKNSFRAFEYNNRYSIAPVVSYQLDKDTKLTAEYTLQYANMSDVGSYYVFSPDGYATLPRDFTTLSPGLPATNIYDHSLFLTLEHQLNPNWEVTAKTAYFKYNQMGSSMWPQSVNADGTMIRAIGSWQAKSKMVMGQVYINGDVTTGTVRHRILGGLDMSNKNYFADWGQSHALDTVGGEFDPRNPYYGAPNNGYPNFDYSTSLESRAVAIGGTMDQRYTGLYLQDELGFLDNKVRLTLAGRYTFVSQSAWGDPHDEAKHFTPRLGLSISIDSQTSVYALHDQAFIPQSGKLTNGDKVKPITGNNTEIGIKKDWFNGRWSTSLAAYRILKKHELAADPNSPPNSGLSIEYGEKRAKGIEFDLRGEIARGLNLIANYAYTDSRVTKAVAGTGLTKGDLVPGFAKHTANSWLSYKIQNGALKGSGISAGFTYLADRATDDSYAETDVRLPDYFKLDGGLFWQKKNITITGNLFNILDKYLYSGSYYSWLNAYDWQAEAPRNYRLSVAYKF